MSAHLRGVKPTLSRDRDPLTKAPPVPSWMTKDARAEWKRVMPRLIGDRIITKADLTGIENYCVCVGRSREIERLIQSGGIDASLVRLADKMIQTARQLAAEYGLSPTSRARVQGQDDEDDADNPLSIR